MTQSRESAPALWPLYALVVFAAAFLVVPLVWVAVVGSLVRSTQGRLEVLAATGSLVLQGVLGFGAYFSWRRLGVANAAMGWSWRGWKSDRVDVGLGIGLGLAITGFAYVFEKVAEALGWDLDTLSAYQAGLGPTWVFACFAVSVVVLAPLGEEVFFRGFLLGMLTTGEPRGAKLFAAVLFTDAVWLLGHPSVDAFVQLAVFGLALGYLRVRRSSLVGPLVAHALNNAIAVGQMWLER